MTKTNPNDNQREIAACHCGPACRTPASSDAQPGRPERNDGCSCEDCGPDCTCEPGCCAQ